VAALAGQFVNELPDNELARYRGEVEAVTIERIQAAAQDHIHPDRLAIVAVGDADAVAAELGSAGFGELEVVLEELPPEASQGEEEGE